MGHQAVSYPRPKRVQFNGEHLKAVSPGSREQEIVRALAEYGMTVHDGTLALSESAIRSPWIMNEMRAIDESIPVVLAPEHMPRAQLVYGLDDPMPLLVEHELSRTYVTLADVEGQRQPVLIKWIDPWRSAQIVYECRLAQVVARLGVSPRFYGTATDSSGRIVGYTMQIVSGETISALEVSKFEAENPEFLTIHKRLRTAGLAVFKDLMRTETEHLVMIDSGDLVVHNETAYLAFVDAAAPEVLPPDAGLEEALAAGHAGRERFDVGA